jgi:hypothetical protein
VTKFQQQPFSIIRMGFEVKVDGTKSEATVTKTASRNPDGSSEFSSNVGSADYDLLRDIKPILIVGRCLSVIPFSGVFGNNASHLNFRYY